MPPQELEGRTAETAIVLENKSSSNSNNDTNSIIDPTAITEEDVFLTAAECNGVMVDCNHALLEQMDNCVDFVEEVDLQHDFERALEEENKRKQLTPKQAAMIRLRAIESNNNKPSKAKTKPPKCLPNSIAQDLDVLNICGDEKNVVSNGENKKQIKTGTNTKHMKETKRTTTIVVQGNAINPTPATVISSFGDALDAACLSLPDACDPTVEVATVTAATATTTTTTVPAILPAPCCTLCFDVPSNNHKKTTTLTQLPCCSSNQNICTTCIWTVLTTPLNSTSRAGRCPFCRTWLVLQNDPTQLQVISSAPSASCCPTCRSPTVNTSMLLPDTCDTCFVQQRHAVLYECETCQNIQQISQPLYREQATAQSFSTRSWECWTCQAPRKWRMRADQIGLLPVGEAPWGDPLQVARRRVQVMRNAKPLANDNKSTLSSHDEDICVIS